MTLTPAILCLALALAGCTGSTPTPTSAPLSRSALCDDAERLVGSELMVEGPFDSEVVTPSGGSAVACEPGSCCNTTFYAPTIGCESAPRIWIGFDHARLENLSQPDLLDFVCRTRSEDLEPSDACPVEPSCADKLGRVTLLRGRLERRTSFEGDEELWLIVSASTTRAEGI